MIYIVRHGQTDWNVEGRYGGRVDVKLNSKGKKKKKITAEKLSGIKFDKVFSSPLKRAIQTAEIICNGKINTDERIIERCNGELEGKLKTEIIEKIDFNDPDNIKYGIEPITDFRNRINEFLDDITKKYVGKNVLVVTHAGVGIYIKCYFEGEPKDGNYSSYKLKNCEFLMYENNK